MATKKILFALSLVLLINPALRCMDDAEEEGMATTKHVLTGLGLGVLSFAAMGLGARKLINNRKQKLLCEAQNIEVFTREKLTESYRTLKESGSELGIYGIFKNSSDETLKKLRGTLVKELFPSNLALLFNYKYNLKPLAVLGCMISMNL